MFWDALPFFLSLGMSEKEFWNSTIKQRGAWYKKYELELDRMSFNAWVQGLYIIKAVHPNSTSKKIEYDKEPLLLREETQEEKDAKLEKKLMQFMGNVTEAANANK